MRINGAEIYYEDTGRGPEAILFAHGLLLNVRVYDHQVAALKDRYRCIRFDFRGQGRSEITRDGYDIDALTEDAAQLIQTLGAAPCHFVGLSMGGFVGMRLAARRPELIRSLILMSTTADEEPRLKMLAYRLLTFIARWLGKRLVTGPVKRILFGKKFRTDPAREVEREAMRQILMSNDRVGISRAARGVFSRNPIAGELDKIHVPTLIIVGEEDVACPPAKARRMHEGIAGSRLVLIPEAGHTVCVEEPAAVNAAIVSFLNTIRQTERRYDSSNDSLADPPSSQQASW